jgi:proteasome beta subunit
VKLGFREDLERDAGVDLAINALFQAADEDSATGGPDLVRRIYPVIATITAAGFSRLADAEIAERFAGLLELMAGREGARARLPETSSDAGVDD